MSKTITDKQIRSFLKEGQAGKHAIGNGLYFRVSKEGTGFWVARYTHHSKRREFIIGRYPEISLADARVEIATIKAGIKKNIDPLAERKRADKTAFKVIDDLAEDWLKDCERRLKHPYIPRRIYTNDFSPYIGRLPLDKVSPIDIRACINNIVNRGRPTVANDALGYAKQLFRHGMKLGLINYSPAEAFSISDAGGAEYSRTRILSYDEISTLFECFHKYSDQFARENLLFCALLLTLGIRKGELVSARWDEFDMKAKLWNVSAEKTKTSVAINVPLPAQSIEWLHELHVRASGSEFVFPKRRASQRFGHMSPDTLNAAICKLFDEKKILLEHFTIHDFRRTFRSLLASEGVPAHIAERCLNHKLKGVEGIYDRYDYLDERREALEIIANKLAPIINKGGNNNFLNLGSTKQS